jgi:thiol-disulfide isomerase/thioredoxin
MKIKVYFIGLMTIMSLQGFAQGIQFSKLSYEEAIATAKAQKKNIFVDVYTTWCGPCKKMSAEVFPLKAVGDFYNANYVCLKLDAENESKHGFFKKYQAAGYPSFFWVNSDGNILDVQIGVKTPEEFVKLGEKAKTSDMQALNKKYEERWKNGERSMDLVKNYVYGILARVNASQVKPHLEDYLSTLSAAELRKPEVSGIIRGFMTRPVDGPIYDYIMRDADVHEKNIGFQEFRTSMYRMLIRGGNVLLGGKSDSLYQKHVAKLRASAFWDKEMYLKMLAFERNLCTGKFNEGLKGMVAAAAEYGAQHPYLYREFCYSLIISGAMKNAEFSAKEGQELIDIASVAFEMAPSKETVTLLSSMYAKAGNYKKAYEIAGASQFYDKPAVVKVYFDKDLGIQPTIVTEFGKTAKKEEMKATLSRKNTGTSAQNK